MPERGTGPAKNNDEARWEGVLAEGLTRGDALAERPASRGEQRRQAFLDAAIGVFLEQGFESASVNEIVRRAGGSLATLYAQFGNKDALFETVIGEATIRFSEPFIRAADNNLERPLHEGLQDIGEQFLQLLLMPRALAFFRLMIGEGRKAPSASEGWVHGGPERVRLAVADYLLARASREGFTLAEREAETFGGFFCDMVRSRHQYRALFHDGEYTLTPEEIRDHVALAVRILLDGLRP